jgi:hypothetical protein
LATHGIYHDPKNDQRIETDEKMSIDGYYMTGRRSTVAARNPLTLCEIHLANSLATYRDKYGVRLRGGVLVAENVAGMDLSNTELVTLSACQTALGEVAGGEGVIGFQRAFNLAGARSVMGSLWWVPDESTKILLERFYRNLWGAKMSRVEALRQAQLTLLREPPRDMAGRPRALQAHYWAAWTLSGDPGGLLRPGEPRPELADPVTPKAEPIKPETPSVKPAPGKLETPPKSAPTEAPAPATPETPSTSAPAEAPAPAPPEPVKDPTPVVATGQIPAAAPNAEAGPWASVAIGGTAGVVIILGWLWIQALARRRRG